MLKEKKLISILKNIKFIDCFEPYCSTYSSISDWIGTDFKK